VYNLVYMPLSTLLVGAPASLLPVSLLGMPPYYRVYNGVLHYWEVSLPETGPRGPLDPFHCWARKGVSFSLPEQGERCEKSPF